MDGNVEIRISNDLLLIFILVRPSCGVLVFDISNLDIILMRETSIGCAPEGNFMTGRNRPSTRNRTKLSFSPAST